MRLLLFVIGVPILAFIGYLLYRMRVGHVIAIHMHRFEIMYKEVFEETKSKELALRCSLIGFKACPVFNKLSYDDYEQIVTILKESPFPEKIIDKIILGMDANTGLKALQSRELLTKMASVGRDA